MTSRSPILSAAAALMLWAVPAAAQPAPAKADAAAAAEPAETAQAETTAEADAGAAASSDVTTATSSEVRAGSAVFDTSGGEVGTVESVDENGAVVSTGSARARLPFSSFGKNDRGLVISMSRAQLEAAVAARTPS